MQNHSTGSQQHTKTDVLQSQGVAGWWERRDLIGASEGRATHICTCRTLPEHGEKTQVLELKEMPRGSESEFVGEKRPAEDVEREQGGRIQWQETAPLLPVETTGV